MEGAITLFAASSLARLRTVVSLIGSITYHIPMIWILPFLDGLVSLLYHHRQENEHLPIRMYVCILGMAVSVRLRAIQYLFRGWHRFRLLFHAIPIRKISPPLIHKRKSQAKSRARKQTKPRHRSRFLITERGRGAWCIPRFPALQRRPLSFGLCGLFAIGGHNFTEPSTAGGLNGIITVEYCKPCEQRANKRKQGALLPPC